MIEDTQNTQQQTPSTTHNTDTPQNPETDIQSTLDQQSLDRTTGSIQIPGANGQTATTQTNQTESTATSGVFPAVDIGTGLLVASFIFAVGLILLLAKFASQNSPEQPDMPNGVLPGEDADRSIEEQAEGISIAPVRPKKKQTRRQRRQQHTKRGQ